MALPEIETPRPHPYWAWIWARPPMTGHLLLANSRAAPAALKSSAISRLGSSDFAIDDATPGY